MAKKEIISFFVAGFEDNMRWNTIIFDLDGTLLNSLEDIRNSVNYTMRQIGVPEKTSDEVKAAVGNGVKHLIKCCLPLDLREDKEVFERAFKIFNKHYLIHSEDKTCPYKGAKKFLEKLHIYGLKTAVVTNKPDKVAQKVVHSFLGELITYVSGEKEGIDRKPAPDLVFDSIHFLHSDKTSCVYIGDSEVDILTAKNAGIPVVLVSWGYRDKKFLESFQPEYLVDDFDMLTSVLIDL